MSSFPSVPDLPVRVADSHKGDFGRLLLNGGSLGMSGSISLSGVAALRSGAGLVVPLGRPTLSMVVPQTVRRHVLVSRRLVCSGLHRIPAREM